MQFMQFYRDLLKFIEICAILWKSMEFYGNLLNSRDLGSLISIRKKV